jgi:hypothetical protein
MLTPMVISSSVTGVLTSGLPAEATSSSEFRLGCGAGQEHGWPPVGGGLVSPPIRGADMVLAGVILVAQYDRARGGQPDGGAPDPGPRRA